MQGFKHLDIISDRNLEMPKRSNSSCTECLKLMQSADRISHSQSMEIIPEEFVKNMQENCQLTALCQAIRGNELIFAMAFRDATPGNRTEACYAIGIC
ncbi:hypothetical protein DdX_05216 [Ditylenchus destructor]|uniref:Uncharacterized protein n=1 Tax=Ditylenchus destructor TaxID=166010 RepID=A0AAD4NCG2_9BILA|nr:hypothetical protein DdX_05216 [Ditylenchus destructor]